MKRNRLVTTCSWVCTDHTIGGLVCRTEELHRQLSQSFAVLSPGRCAAEHLPSSARARAVYISTTACLQNLSYNITRVQHHTGYACITCSAASHWICLHNLFYNIIREQHHTGSVCLTLPTTSPVAASPPTAWWVSIQPLPGCPFNHGWISRTQTKTNFKNMKLCLWCYTFNRVIKCYSSCIVTKVLAFLKYSYRIVR